MTRLLDRVAVRLIRRYEMILRLLLRIRTNYIHWIADLLGEIKEKEIFGVDMYVVGVIMTKNLMNSRGTGASCIYPLLGARMYNWNFVATEIDPESIECAQQNIQLNPDIESKIEIIQVPNEGERRILKHVLPASRTYEMSSIRTFCSYSAHYT